MRRKLARIAEVGMARVVPGLLNVLALVLLAGYLSLEDYGVFSTILATGGLIASVVYGPVNLSIVPLYSGYDALGKRSEFESSLLGMALLISLLVSLAGLAFWAFGFISFWLVVVVIVTGLSGALQPIFQARIEFWKYGLINFIQSSLFLLTVFVWVVNNPLLENAVRAYAVCMAISVFFAWLLLEEKKPRVPRLELLKKKLYVGTPFAMSTMAESGIFLGFRYILLLTGNTALLGTFSLAVDVAQRAVGVVINIASFAILPLAYQALSKKDVSAFVYMLVRGTLLSGAMAVVMLIAVIVVSKLNLFDALKPPAFSGVAFFIIATAVIVNRLRKLMIDPLAVRNQRGAFVAAGYLVAAPIALGIGWLALYLDASSMFYMSYLIGYLVAALFTVLWSNVRDSFN